MGVITWAASMVRSGWRRPAPALCAEDISLSKHEIDSGTGLDQQPLPKLVARARQWNTTTFAARLITPGAPKPAQEVAG